VEALEVVRFAVQSGVALCKIRQGYLAACVKRKDKLL
jgi:hypothetical protein